MSAKIYKFQPRHDAAEFDGGDGDGPIVHEIRIVLEAPELPEDPEPIKAPAKQRTWPAFLFGALLGLWFGG